MLNFTNTKEKKTLRITPEDVYHLQIFEPKQQQGLLSYKYGSSIAKEIIDIVDLKAVRQKLKNRFIAIGKNAYLQMGRNIKNIKPHNHDLSVTFHGLFRSHNNAIQLNESEFLQGDMALLRHKISKYVFNPHIKQKKEILNNQFGVIGFENLNEQDTIEIVPLKSIIDVTQKAGKQVLIRYTNLDMSHIWIKDSSVKSVSAFINQFGAQPLIEVNENSFINPNYIGTVLEDSSRIFMQGDYTSGEGIKLQKGLQLPL